MGLTTEEAASRLGITTRAVVKLCKEGKLDARKHGRDWDITPDSVQAYQENRPKPGPKPKGERV
jgi:excisionase family DNA binding protein